MAATWLFRIFVHSSAPFASSSFSASSWLPARHEWRRVLWLALSYILAAWAGHQMPLFADYVSPLWPAAGIALAGLIAWGPHCWPGILLGNLITDILLGPGSGAPFTLLLTGAGVTLQAVVGARLILLHLELKEEAQTDQRLLWLLLCSGPLVCLIAPSIGLLALALDGNAYPAEPAMTWATWWVGDTVGVLLFAPAALALWPGANPAQQRWEGDWHIAVTPLVTALLLIGGLVQMSRFEAARTEAAVQQQLDMLTDRTLLQLVDAVEPLRGLVRHFEASERGTQGVTRESFARFTRDITHSAAIHAVDWAPRVTAAQRAYFESSVRADNFTAFSIADIQPGGFVAPSPQRDEYFPVLYTEPLPRNRHALGLDHAGHEEQRRLMRQALEHPGTAWPQRIQPGRTDRPGLMVFLPVPAVLPLGMDKPDGFVVGVLDQEQLLAPLLAEANEHRIALRLQDARASILHDSLPASAEGITTRTLSHAGLNWQLDMLPASGAHDATALATRRIYLGFSMLAALLVAFAVLGSAARNAITRARVASRTAELATALATLNARELEERAVLDNIVECVITIDCKGIMLNANPAIEAMFGYAADEVIGRNVSMLMTEADSSAHDGYLERYLRTGERRIIGRNREVQGRHKDGRNIPLELAVSEYVFGERRVFTGTLRDISERKALVKDLMRAREHADEANRAKSAFLASMSHEIRTPMNGVVGLVDVLARSDLNEYQRDLVRTIRDSSTSLLTLIDDILDFSKIEAGRLEIEHRPIHLIDIIEGVCSSLSPMSVRRGVELSLFIAPEIPAGMMSDEVRLRQVLYNILGNAIKFSGGRPDIRGEVSLHVEMGPQKQQISFCIRDNGIGIAAERLNDLFRPFTQAESSTTRRYGGTGLGLAICKRLVSMLGGSIQVASTLGEGSCFTVTLPFQPASGISTPPAPALDGLHCILTPRGKALDGDILQRYLEQAGAHVLRPDSEEDFCALLQQPLEAPVIVLDSLREGMPPISLPAGPNEARSIRILRGRSSQMRGTRRQTITVDGNLLRRNALLRAVAVAAGRTSPEQVPRSFAQPLDTLAATPPDPQEARRQGRLILVAEDNDINRKVIQQQLALLGLAAEIAHDGNEALRMWSENDYALLLTDLHMPNMDGYTLASAIRAAEKDGEHMPILALTANALRGEERRAIEVGMDAYLTKPVSLEVLRETLGRFLPAGQSLSSPPPTAAADPFAEALKQPLFDVSVLEELVGDDQEIVREFLEEFRRSANELAETLHNALAAGQAREAGNAAHKLKSAARSVGALELGERCADIERRTREEEFSTLSAILPSFTACMLATSESIDAFLHQGRYS